MGIMNLPLFLLSFVLFSVMQCPTLALKRSYVVYLGGHSHGSQHTSEMDLNRITDSHHDLLGSCLGSKEKAHESIFYSYTHHINGFAANLEDEEAAELSKRPGVVSIFLNQKHKLQTTRSWEFLGLERNGEIPADSIWVKARFGEDIIIGNIDSGVWPESESFNDQGMGPIPSKWKGYCEPNDDVKCNRKLIGARYFNKGVEAKLGSPLNSSYQTVRDTNGHGTHTLSTAGGRFVGGANLLGSGYGTAKGGSPSARVASYKSCWPDCNDVDVLAAIDAAIHDGVDILSLSIAFVSRDYFLDSIAIGSLHAVQNGIVVVCAGGNEGPTPGSVTNLAPWILTVAASTIDREFPSNVMLGNNKQFKGLSFKTNSLTAEKFYPLVYSVDARAANASARDAQICSVGSLDPKKVKGKIVYCLVDPSGLNALNVEKSWVVAQAGGIGMILANHLTTATLIPQAHFVPTSRVSAADGLAILLYIHTTKYPVAYISGATEVGTVTAPIMASFSSQGPNTITPEILKPDITAPGVQIIAAYTEARGPTFLQSDDRRVLFNIASGTSMACPHVSGAVGLLKKIHPNWSPSAIRSAIMTSARTRSNLRQPIANGTLAEGNPFNYGAGHLSPNRAMDPGLVYDLTITDYLNFLCSIGYNTTQLSTFVDKKYECPSKPMRPWDLNYPSITVPSLSGKVTVTRTLKNVGTPATYTVRIKAPSGISVKVEPKRLRFEKINEEKMFKVTIEAKRDDGGGEYVFGRLIWSDGKHYVGSPIVVNATTFHMKLIGARYFNKGVEAELGSPLNSSYQTVRDTNGHGTHTLFTAGGRFVGGANLLGSGYGTAKGGSPSARVASYKSCWPDCNDVDVLAAIDAAIHDGVDILSLSIAFVSRDYFLDSIAIGSLHAVQNGIVVVCAGGNEGPTPGSVKNMAPWIITVAASTIDRDFPSNVTLGNNQQFKGRSFYTNSLPAEKFYPLVYSVDARAANASASDAQVCSVGSLDPKKVKGKIVYCLVGVNENVEKSWVVAQAGGIGMILSDRLSTDTSFSEPHFVPTSPVSAFDGLSILLYIHTTKYPVAYISGATEVGKVAAPILPSFSSQGPNPITPEILKPDLTAPGVQIVAAYSEATGPTDLQSDDRRVPFSIISGTSMSCPHVAGTIGLLKKIHPDWSPSALRSAIMTTARTRTNVRQPLVNETLGEASPFSYGAGHLWPSRAMDPGLVYDLTTTDYLNFLCSIGYNATQLSTFVDKGYECPSKPMSLLDLNYPSITVPSLSGKVTVTRTLKNVGTPATYTVRTEVPSGISVKVEPNTLKFEKINEEKTFKVTLEAKRDGEGGEYVFGRLIWSDGEHYVRSPIVVNATTL